MGEIADMMLDGILDANGEYTGHNYGHPVYPKGWHGKRTSVAPSAKNKVVNFLSIRGVDDRKKQRNMMIEFAGNVTLNKTYDMASSNWKQFKEFVDDHIGYVKPSKQITNNEPS